jgi:pSer/pThr/pTyr-binding forkhead associated (FHA) protein
MTLPARPEPLALPAAFAAACKFTTPIPIRAVHRVTGAVQSHTAVHPFAFIGRAQGISVRLDDPSVSQCHAYLQVVDGRPHCFDLGSRTGVFSEDGNRVHGQVSLGRVLRIGAFDVQIGDELPVPVALPPALPTVAAPPAVLEVHATGVNGHFSLDRPVTLIGRHPNCHLRFLDPEVAYLQCVLIATHDGVWFLDMPNRTATTVNGRAARLTRLHDGDLLELGRVSLVLRDGPPKEEPLVLAARGGFSGGATAPARQELDSMTAALSPLREVMEQFQQCFVNMVRMVTVMQQEHTAMMCEQMRQVQELIRELREAQKAAAAAPPTAPSPSPAAPSPAAPRPASPPSPKPPAPKAPSAPEIESLADAHNWFLDRLAKLGQSPPPK